LTILKLEGKLKIKFPAHNFLIKYVDKNQQNIDNKRPDKNDKKYTKHLYIIGKKKELNASYIIKKPVIC
jgi:disulfide oxidoreductase YuzD